MGSLHNVSGYPTNLGHRVEQIAPPKSLNIFSILSLAQFVERRDNSTKREIRLKHFLVLAITGLSIAACSNAEPVVSTHERLEASGEYLVFNASTAASSTLSNRPPSLRLIVSVSPPEIDDQTLQATDIHLVSNQAFISYNVAGETQMGAVDVIDISRITRPEMVSSLELPNHDANAIFRHKKNVYIVGAVDTGGASLLRIGYERNQLDDSFDSQSLESFAGTDVMVNGSKLYATSGNRGGLEIFDLDDLTRIDLIEVSDARGVAYDKREKSTRVISGQPGIMHVVNDDEELEASIELGGNSAAESKSTIEAGNSSSIVSLGDKGLKVVCNENGAELLHIEAVRVKGLDSSVTVTNAASMDNGLIFAANGEAGLYVYETKKGSKIPKTSCHEIKASLLGSINFGNGFSANHVVYKKNYLFVATGLGGLKIVEISRGKSDDDYDDFDDDHDDEHEDRDDDD